MTLESNSDCDGESSPVSTPETEDDLLLDSEGSREECETSSRHSVPGNQPNNITVKNPTSPTTLVINSSPSTSSTANAQSACPKLPGDIASSPAFPPYNLQILSSQLLLFLGKLGHLTQHGTISIHGWSTPHKEMHVTVTAVNYLALELVPNVSNHLRR